MASIGAGGTGAPIAGRDITPPLCSIVAERLRGRVRGPNAEIVDVVTAMLADPWVAHVLSRDAADS